MTTSIYYRVELIFVQMRKALEEIAFASLSANRAKDSEIHAKFATFWRAKDLLREIGQINPEFYPVPVQMLSDRVGESLTNFRFEPITDGFLTKADFVSLAER